MQRNRIRRNTVQWALVGIGLLVAAWVVPSTLLAQDLEGAPQSWGPYTVTTSWEIGARMSQWEGSKNKYRSDLNYGRGARLFNVNFLARAEDNKATKLFDTFRLNGFGFGGDPNAMLSLQFEKNRWYQFNYTYRKLDYFSFLNNIALGQHQFDLERRWQDFNLTFFPQSRFRILLGYSRNSSFGPSLTTFDYSRDEFLLTQNVRRQTNDYSMGWEWRMGGAVLSFEQGFRTYREDTQQRDTVPNAGNSFTTVTTINTLRRDNPTRVFAPYTRLGLHAKFWKKFDFSGRYLYSGSTTDYIQAQVLTGRDSSNNTVDLQTTSVLAKTRRPNGAFDASLTFMAHDRIWFSNSVSLTNFRIVGDSLLDETLLRSRQTPFGTTTLPPLVTEDFEARFLGVRYLQNLFDVNIRAAKQLSFRIGYRFTQRRTLMSEDPGEPLERVNTEANTVLVGFRFQPHHIWTLYYDLEHGNTINPFTRVSNYDINNHRIRTQFKPHKTFVLSGSILLRANTNPTPFVSNEFRNRSYAINASWLPNERFTLDVGYDRIHVGTDAGIIFFIANRLNNGRSLYISNSNLFYSSARIVFCKRVELYAAYRIVNDTGTDRLPASANEFVAQFPLKFQTPEVRLAVKLRDGVEWIAGYQFYKYAEDLQTTQNYRAHLPYSSLRLYF